MVVLCPSHNVPNWLIVGIPIMKQWRSVLKRFFSELIKYMINYNSCFNSRPVSSQLYVWLWESKYYSIIIPDGFNSDYYSDKSSSSCYEFYCTVRLTLETELACMEGCWALLESESCRHSPSESSEPLARPALAGSHAGRERQQQTGTSNHLHGRERKHHKIHKITQTWKIIRQ